MEKYTVKVEKFTAQEKGILKGHLDVRIVEMDWLVRGCTLFQGKDGGNWIKMPNRFVKGAITPDGKPVFEDIIDLPANKRKEFSDLCVEAYKKWCQEQAPSVAQPKASPYQEEIPF